MLRRTLALPRPVRWLLAVAGLAAAAVFAWLSAGPPQLTLLNSSLVVDFPWPRGAAALACAAALAFSAVLAPLARARWVGLVWVLLPLAVGLHLLLYRVEAGDAGLRTRGLGGARTLSWLEVRALRLGGEAVTVEAAGAEIRIDTADFSPDQRAALARSLARRVNEAGGGPVLTVPD